MIGGLREGGVGYYALDVTQPDKLKMSDELGAPIPDDNGATNWLPNCMTDYSSGDCGPNRYPAPLWEFARHHRSTATWSGLALPLALPMDEDRNGISDLGDGWSTPNIGRIRVCRAGGTHCAAEPGRSRRRRRRRSRCSSRSSAAASTATRSTRRLPSRGDWLYMLDIETGKVIYKRELCSPYSTGLLRQPGQRRQRAGGGRHQPRRLPRPHLPGDHRRLPVQGRPRPGEHRATIPHWPHRR